MKGVLVDALLFWSKKHLYNSKSWIGKPRFLFVFVFVFSLPVIRAWNITMSSKSPHPHSYWWTIVKYSWAKSTAQASTSQVICVHNIRDSYLCEITKEWMVEKYWVLLLTSLDSCKASCYYLDHPRPCISVFTSQRSYSCLPKKQS